MQNGAMLLYALNKCGGSATTDSLIKKMAELMDCPKSHLASSVRMLIQHSLELGFIQKERGRITQCNIGEQLRVKKNALCRQKPLRSLHAKKRRAKLMKRKERKRKFKAPGKPRRKKIGTIRNQNISAKATSVTNTGCQVFMPRKYSPSILSRKKRAHLKRKYRYKDAALKYKAKRKPKRKK